MLRVDTLAMISRRLTCLALHKQHQSSWGAPLYYTISCPCTNVDSYTAQTVVTTFARLQPGHQVKQIHQGTDPVQLYPNPDQLLQQPTVCVPHALQGGAQSRPVRWSRSLSQLWFQHFLGTSQVTGLSRSIEEQTWYSYKQSQTCC